MTYASQDQLTGRFGERLLVQLTDRNAPPIGAIDAAVVADALAATDAVIDGYLAGRYVLPLATTPPLIGDLALSIAIYRLHQYAPEAKIIDDYKDAIATLGKIANGQVRLPVAGVELAATDATSVMVTDRERDLTPDNMIGFI